MIEPRHTKTTPGDLNICVVWQKKRRDSEIESGMCGRACVCRFNQSIDAHIFRIARSAARLSLPVICWLCMRSIRAYMQSFVRC